jgi:hypothetical protein
MSRLKEPAATQPEPKGILPSLDDGPFSFQRVLLLYPEDGGSKTLRNTGTCLSNYTASHPTRQ